jgi:hypothetical protein
MRWRNGVVAHALASADAGRLLANGVPFFVKDVAVMTEEHAPNEDAMKIAEEGIRGMINALGPEAIAPDVMIDAALHILAAWVASSRTNATPGEREADIAELEESLPSYIEYHRSAKWLPEPRRSDN